MAQWQKELRHSDGLAEERTLIVFHTPETEEMAKSVVALHPEYLRLGAIRWEKFGDGFPNLFIENVESIYGRHVVFISSFQNTETFFSQLSIIYTLPRYLVKSMTIVVPYFPTGTMERVDEEGQVATAQTLARLLSSAPLSVGGPMKMIVYDIHTLQNRFYFTDNVIPLLVTATGLFRQALATKHADDKIVIAFPDDGAFKRFGSKFESFPIVICSKVREGTKRIVKIKDGESFVPGAHVFIVDDLVQTGGTLIECKNVLFDAGAAKVSAYVTHAVFPHESFNRFVEPQARPFNVFYTTDSCPEVARLIRDKPPFHVLPLAPSIADNLLKYSPTCKNF
eukprot:TRINITY_DN4627_c0_g1_i1.p1 TRINITY_DN4627_c0_g1~~TRINITY_DN4627_c0_g1_i1.p1  ORF type:complete len:338 (+),score=114.89 TRINITY_DN4627_c0_g1_i1:108-1121(+)